MSADPDKDTACPKADTVVVGPLAEGDSCHDPTDKKRKKPRSVKFPDDDQLVTQYFEPANPWHDVPTTTRAQLAAEYLEACRRHETTPIDSVLQQIREFPENAIGGGERSARLTLSACSLVGSAPADALEALLRKVQFRRLEVEHAEIDDEGAEALFDMIEYYESANVVCISGPRQFGIRGWQAACRMIKKSAELSEVEVCESALCASHAPVLVRALRPHACRLRALCLQRAHLQGEPLLCLVIALKSNSSIRELRLPDNELTVSDAQQLGSLLRFNLNIQLLDLSNNQIQDAGAGYIADALVEQADQTPPSAATSPLSPHHFPLGYESRVGLAFLVLWNNQLTRNCAPHLSKALRSSQSLCVLNIGRNALGAETVRALCGGGALVSLGLQSARLGPEAARPLAELVRADTKLQRLDLRDNRLGVVGLQAILNAMKDNTTLTQIDLDDPVESRSASAEGGWARLARDIGALCRRNEPAAEPQRRVLRRISLTCRSAAPAATGPGAAEAARRSSRLRSPAPSPAPSPAGSPTPHNQHTSRFSVTRVTPERESSAESTSPSTPTRPTYCLAPSRFKVVQVAEPPQIQIHPATKKRPPSRFSVTRNYDAIYNPSPSVSPVPGSSPTPGSFGASPTIMTCRPPLLGVFSDMPLEVAPAVVVSACTSVFNSPVVVVSASTAAITPAGISEPSVVITSPAVISEPSAAITSPAVVISASTAVITSSAMISEPSAAITSPAVVISASTAVITSSAMISEPSAAITSPVVISKPSAVISEPLAAMSSPAVVISASTAVITSPAMISEPSAAITSPVVISEPSAAIISPAVMINEPSEVITSTAVISEPSAAITSPAVMISASTVAGASSGATGVFNVSPAISDSTPQLSCSPIIDITTTSSLRDQVVSSTAVQSSFTPMELTGGSPTAVTSSVTEMLSHPPTTSALTRNLPAGVQTSVTLTPDLATASPTILTSATPTATTGVSKATAVSPFKTTCVNTKIVSSSSVSVSTEMLKSSPADLVAPGVKVPPTLTAVPSVSPEVSPMLGCESTVTAEPFIPNIDITASRNVDLGTLKIIEMNTVPDSKVNYDTKKSSGVVLSTESNIGTSESPDPQKTVPVEDIWKQTAVTDINSMDIPSKIFNVTPSNITMIGPVSETSMVTLSGSHSSGDRSGAYNSDESIITLKEYDVHVSPEESELQHTRREPLIKLTEIGPSPLNMERRFGPTVIPDVVKPAPDSRFPISPIPDLSDILPYEVADIKDISEAVAKGSHSNIAIDLQIENNRRIKEADILTKIAEIAETIGPKVEGIEPKDVPKATEIEDVTMQLITENKPKLGTLTSICRDVISKPNTTNTAATSLIDVSSDVGSSECEGNKSIIDRTKQKTMPIDEYKLKDTPDKIMFAGQTKTEGQDTCADVKVRPATDMKQTEVFGPIKETITHKDVIDKIGLKPILKDLKDTDLRKELSKCIAEPILEDTETHEGDDVPKLDRNTASSDITDSAKDNSDAKKSDPSDDNGKNKSYSDVVKSDLKYKDKSEQLTHREEISDSVVKTETNLVRNSVEVTDLDKVDVKVEVTVKKESAQDATKVHSDQNKDFVNIDDIIIKKDVRTMKQIEAITEDLGNLIQEMKHMSSKSRKVKSDCTVGLASVDTNKVPGNFNRDVVLKKNKSESSLDSPDLEVSRLMNKKLVGSPFCDSSSSLEISGSSMESLNAIENQHACQISKQVVIQESIESDSELDRRKSTALSTENSVESTSEVTPVNTNYLNMSVSSNESVSPIIFGKKKKIHDSLSSLEASMSSLDSGRQEKVMVTSADSGIEYSLQHPSENKEDNSSNEGTLTHNSSLKETVKKDQETLTSSPKRASSLLDVPALKTKGLDRMRKISWVAPSSSFHIPRVEAEKFEKPSHLEKLLSLFQHPTSLFSRGSQSDEERKSASNTPPRKDSSLSSSFWSWGSAVEKDKDDKEDSSEATDSTLSERVQVSFVDESFSKKLDSKTPSTDTDNTLSEFQSFPTQTEEEKKVTDDTTDENLVQTLGLSLNTDKAGNGNRDTPRASDTTDLSKPNDLNRNYEIASDENAGDVENKSENRVIIDKDETKIEAVRPRSFAAVLKSSGSANSLDKQPSPDSGQLVDKLPSKVIRGIKENISPENTLTSSMTNTNTLAFELTERQVKNQAIVNAAWEVTGPVLDKTEPKTEEVRITEEVKNLAPIATIDESCDEAADNTVNIQINFIDDIATNEKLESEKDKAIPTATRLETVDLGKDALSYLIYESQDFEPETEQTVAPPQVEGSLAQELKEAEIKEMLDLSPELVIDETVEIPVFAATDIKGIKSSPVIPERAKLKKSNSLEDLSQRQEDVEKGPKTKTIAFEVPETTSPRDIPDRRPKLRTMSGSSPKSLPESLNKPSPLVKLDTGLRKRKKVSSLGRMAKDSLLALNMSEDEITDYRRSYVTSVESLRSLESVSEDANSQSGTSVDSRCHACLRTSQESLMSLDSITEDCKCISDGEKPGRSVR